MSKLIVITAPSSSLLEERDAVEKEIQSRMGDRAVVAVLPEGWTVAEFTADDSRVRETLPREPKSVASVLLSALKLANAGTFGQNIGPSKPPPPPPPPA